MAEEAVTFILTNMVDIKKFDWWRIWVKHLEFDKRDKCKTLTPLMSLKLMDVKFLIHKIYACKSTST